MRAVLQKSKMNKRVNTRKVNAKSSFILSVITCLFISGSAFAQCTPPSHGLIHHWKLEETSGPSLDSAGSENGTWINGGPTSVSGVIDNGHSFSDSPLEHIEMNPLSALDSKQTLTLSAWMKRDTATDNVMLGRREALRYAFFMSLWGDGVLYATVGDGTTGIEGSVAVPGTSWYHVAMVFDGTQTGNANRLAVYVNSIRQSLTFAGTVPSVTETTTDEFKIGSNSTFGSNGSIDDVRIYDRALSADEVGALYATRSTADKAAGYLAYDARHSRYIYCNGTDWVHAGVGSYNPNAVNFDGTNDYLVRGAGLTGVTDAKTATGSFWFKQDTTGSLQYLMRGLGARFELERDSSNYYQILATNTTPTTILNIGGNTAITDSDWHHVLFSFDLSDTAKRHWYIDDVSDLSVITFTDDNIDFTVSDYGLGADPTGASPFNGSIAEFWIDFGTYIDFSVESNRRKFVSENGMPMYLGADGSLPTGDLPDVFLTGDTEEFHLNKGTGGNFTENGTLTTSTTQPATAILAGSNVEILNNPFDADAEDFSYADINEPGNTDADGYYNSAIGNTANGALSIEIFGPTSGVETNMEGSWGATITPSSNLTNAQIDLAYWHVHASENDTGEDSHAYVEMDGVRHDDAGGNGFISSALGSGGLYSSGWTSITVDLPDMTANVSYNIELGLLHDGANNSNEWGSVSFDDVVITGDTIGCSNTPGVSGQLQYNSAFKVMQYCNGAEWTAMGPVARNAPTSGLVAHWTMDETTGTTVADDIGSYDGIWNGSAAVASVTGIIDTGLDFDGSNDYIDNISNTLVSGNNLDDSLSISFWAKPTTAAPSVDMFGVTAAFNAGLDQGAAVAFQPNGSVSFRTGTGSVFSSLNTAADYTTDWQHFVATWDGTTKRIFVDTVEDTNTQAFSGTISYTATESFIGAGSSGSNVFSGSIDDVRIYDRALSTQEISELYQHGLSGGNNEITGTSCSNPTRPESTLFYNADFDVLQYCNGEDWVGVGQ